MWATIAWGFVVLVIAVVLVMIGTVAVVATIYAAAGAVYGEISQEGKENHAAKEASQSPRRVPPGEGR